MTAARGGRLSSPAKLGSTLWAQFATHLAFDSEVGSGTVRVQHLEQRPLTEMLEASESWQPSEMLSFRICIAHDRVW